MDGVHNDSKTGACQFWVFVGNTQTPIKLHIFQVAKATIDLL
jgi:hypothetical protein